jgi:hypothetical protein
MIDHTLVISPAAALVFHLKQGFFLYAWPMLMGFVTVVGYQTLNKIGMAGTAKWPILFLLASVVSMITLFGWVMMSRGLERIPLYGMGFGLGTAMMSRVYALTLPIHPRLKMRFLRVTWRGDAEGIERLKQGLRARAAAARPGTDATV